MQISKMPRTHLMTNSSDEKSILKDGLELYKLIDQNIIEWTYSKMWAEFVCMNYGVQKETDRITEIDQCKVKALA